MILASIFFLSFSSLCFEVLLTRVFSISQWNHLSFMVISIALFGFAVAGTVVSLAESRQRRRSSCDHAEASLYLLIAGYSVSGIIAFELLNRLPLDYFRIPVEWIQLLYLLLAYLLLALPFFFTGLMVCLAYAFRPEKTGAIYLATMSGSACGAVSPPLLLEFTGLEPSILIVTAIPLILILFHAVVSRNRQIRGRAIAVATGALAVFVFTPHTVVSPSSYKSLRQLLRFPDTRIVETATSLRGRMDRVESPYIRFAPGLSLTFTRSLPRQYAIYKDGDSPLYLYDIKRPSDIEFVKSALSYAGYVLNPKPHSALLLISDGGMAIPCALAAETEKITIVHSHPYVAEKIRRHYNLPAFAEDPRGFLSRSKEKYAVIHVEDWGPSLPGTAALNQSHRFTSDAMEAYLAHLDPSGVVILSRNLLLPPADSIRLWATAFEALEAMGIPTPENHLILLRNWGAFTLLISKPPIQQTEIIRQFARNLNFDLVNLPDLDKADTNQYNQFDRPYHFSEISRIKQSYNSHNEKAYFKAYLLDVTPQSDNRPFPSRFLKWTRIRDQYQSMGSRFYSLFLSGEVIVGAVFLEACGITCLLLLVPLIGLTRKGKKPSAAAVFFFLGVGFGFMFIELYFIKSFALLFGDPVISLTVVLSGVLIYSGAGGFLAERIGANRLGEIVLALSAILAFSCFGLKPLMRLLLAQTEVIRFVSAFLILMPFGFFMGIPFPLGMRRFLSTPVQRAYGWALNGCASVLTSIVSIQVALSLGISYLAVCALAAYGLVYLSFRCMRQA